MSKKFAKLLVFSAAIGSAIGAAYYFARKKNAEADSAEEDYDDFSEEKEDKSCDSRSYVPLNPEDGAKDETASAEESASSGEAPGEETSTGEDGFTHLADFTSKAAETVQNTEETVEEFFDEDSTTEEPPIKDN